VSKVAGVIIGNARCTCGPGDPFQAFKVERRAPGPRDVLIDIAEAYERLQCGDMRYRFAIDIATMTQH
jgi:D-arabinose 1-dehydrogenase-like Zn-dependent alcohol dehydrogenase